MKRIASIAVLLALCGLLAFAAQARADTVLEQNDCYAAIAYSPSTGSFGYAYNCDTRDEAEELALRNCKGSDARIVTWVNNGFCALALGDDRSVWGVGWSWGDDATNTEAKNNALSYCRQQTTGSRIVVCVYSGNYRPEVYR